MTDFVQKLNYRRALEGELSKTIAQLNNVKNARVHIVLPEKALFVEDQKVTTASVVLNLKGQMGISQENIQAIVHLVASSVEGLEPENVTIIDTRGRILSNNSGSSDLIAMSSNQMQLTKKVEDYLIQKTQGMLDNIVGPGNAIVRISADLDFTRVEKTVEEYDPDNTVVRSEQIVESEEQNSSGVEPVTQTSSGGVAKTSETITNYDINKTVKHVIEDVGNIKKITVAVVVNNKPKVVEKENGKELAFDKRTPEEISTITDFVKNAIGFDETRGDKISVQAINFTSPMLEEEFMEELKPVSYLENIFDYLKYGVVIALVIITMLLVRSIANTVSIKPDILPEPLREIEEAYTKALPHEAGQEALSSGAKKRKSIAGVSEVPAGLEEELSEEVLAKSEFREKIKRYVEEKPEEAVKLLRVWMYEEEEQ